MLKRWLAVVALVCVGLVLRLEAQNPSESKKDSPGNEQEEKKKASDGEDKKADELPKKTNLFLVARVGMGDKGNTLSKSTLLENFITGMNISGCKCSGEPMVKPIAPSVFRDLNRIVSGVGGEPWKVMLKNKVELSQAQLDDSTLLLIKLPNGFQIEEMDIETVGGSSLTGVYSPAAKDGKRMALLTTNPITYSIPWELNAQINKIKMKTLSDADASSKVDEFDASAVKADKFFSVTVRDFEGDKNKLIKTLKNPEKFEDVITIGADLSEYSVQIATLGLSTGDIGTDLDDKNNLVLTIPQNSKRTSSKVWVKFPLTEAEAVQECVKINASETVGQAYKMIKAIEGKIEVKDMAEVTPEKGAQWFELPPTEDKSQFSRTLALKDLDGLMKKYAQFYLVVVRERSYPGEERVEIIRAPDLANVNVLNKLGSMIREKTGAAPKPPGGN